MRDPLRIHGSVGLLAVLAHLLGCGPAPAPGRGPSEDRLAALEARLEAIERRVGQAAAGPSVGVAETKALVATIEGRVTQTAESVAKGEKAVADVAKRLGEADKRLEKAEEKLEAAEAEAMLRDNPSDELLQVSHQLRKSSGTLQLFLEDPVLMKEALGEEGYRDEVGVFVRICTSEAERTARAARDAPPGDGSPKRLLAVVHSMREIRRTLHELLGKRESLTAVVGPDGVANLAKALREAYTTSVALSRRAAEDAAAGAGR